MTYFEPTRDPVLINRRRLMGFLTGAVAAGIISKSEALAYLQDASKKTGVDPTKWNPETVEAMAKYSKSIWPGLPTVAKVAPSLLAKASFTWTYLDAGWATYNTRLGDLRTYLASESKAATGEHLGFMVGLNLLDAAGVNTAPMTASQIMQLGTIAAKTSSVCALVGWQYDASYVGQAGIRAALDSVAKVAKSRSVASCAVN